MIALDGETPCFYWTFEDFEDLKRQRTDYGFQRSVWRHDTITSYAIGESYVTFHSPDEWGGGDSPIRFDRQLDGRYEYLSEGITYEGVRADTQNHVVLTGRWMETGFGNGVFIAVFPMKENECISKSAMEAVPLREMPVEMGAVT